MKAALLIVLLATAALLVSQPAPREQVGPLPGGGFLLNSGWRIQSAGTHVPVDTFPMSAALSPDGKHLLVLNSGYNPPSISVIDTAAMKETARVPVAGGWLGLTFSPNGDRVYVGGGSQAAVFEFTFSNGALQPSRTFPIVAAAKRTARDFIGDVALSPNGRMLYAADLYRDSLAVINPQSGMVIERVKTGRRPYRILFHPEGTSLFVTSWTDGSLGHYDAANGSLIETVRLGPHVTDMVWRAGKNDPVEGELTYVARLFVAAANTNSVYSVSVTESKQLRLAESIEVSMARQQPLGMTPSALTLSPDGSRLYVVCSDANAVAVVDVTLDRSRLLGFIPVGWYPTAARALRDGRVAVVNGRGLRSYANPDGPNPVAKPPQTRAQYVAGIQSGSVSVIAAPTLEHIAEYTEAAIRNTPFPEPKPPDAAPAGGGPLPTRPGETSPIQHVIYILKENRTYDQVFGDVKEGNGDASLVRFGEQVTPNHHKLAREFVLLDNFYVNGDVDADGQNWSIAAIAPDYVQKLWPDSYGGRRARYDYEGAEPTATPPSGYLWTQAAGQGLALRNYGHFVNNLAKPEPDGTQVANVRDSVLARVTNRKYRGFDLDYPDVERAKVFLADLAGFEQSGEMPRLLLMRLGNDRTSGAAAGKISPSSAVADNDYALGMIVEGVSKSRFWPSTAIFVLEDDAQDGADHVDSHRSPAFVVSPYVKRRTVDGTMYNTTSMLRTMELILGLRPMTQFDAGARPMAASFQAKPDLSPYTAEKPRIALDQRNPASAGMASTINGAQTTR